MFCTPDAGNGFAKWIPGSAALPPDAGAGTRFALRNVSLFFPGYFISLCACSALLTRGDPICIAQYFSIKGRLELKNLSTPVTRTSADTRLVGLLFVADVVVEARFRTASVETPTTINKSITNHHSQLLRRIPFFYILALFSSKTRPARCAQLHCQNDRCLVGLLVVAASR